LPLGTRVEWKSVAEPADKEGYLRQHADLSASSK